MDEPNHNIFFRYTGMIINNNKKMEDRSRIILTCPEKIKW